MDVNKAGIPALHGRLTSADILNSQSSLAFGSVPDIQTRQNLETKEEKRGLAASEVRRHILLVSCNACLVILCLHHKMMSLVKCRFVSVVCRCLMKLRPGDCCHTHLLSAGARWRLWLGDCRHILP